MPDARFADTQDATHRSHRAADEPGPRWCRRCGAGLTLLMHLPRRLKDPVAHDVLQCAACRATHWVAVN